MQTQPLKILVNRTQPITHPSQKATIGRAFYAHTNYEQIDVPIEEALSLYQQGYQIIFGGFEHDRQAVHKYQDMQRLAGVLTPEGQRNLDDAKHQAELIRTEDRWKGQQAFFVEIDKGIKERTITDFINARPFIKSNAWAVTESIRSRYNDPHDKDCNGALRLRVWYLLPAYVESIDLMKFIITKTLQQHPDADKTGSNITNGGIGRKNALSQVLGHTLNTNTLQAWHTEYLNRPKEQPHTPIDTASLTDLPKEYHDAISEMNFPPNNRFAKPSLPCIFTKHQHDGWGSTQNAMGVSKSPNGDLTFHCFKCGEWRTYKKITRPSVQEPPSFPHFTIEQRALIKQDGLDPNAGYVNGKPFWTPRFPQQLLNGQPPEVMKRRIYTNDIRPCQKCNGLAAYYVDRYLLTSGTFCSKCHTDQQVNSYLNIELSRRPKDTIDSDWHGYLSDDPNIQDMNFWHEGTMVHLAAAMGKGKTREILRRAYDDSDHAIYLLLTPRQSLARAIYEQESQNTGGWGAFFGGSQRDDKKIRSHGAIGTVTALPQMLANIIEEGLDHHPIRIAIDEIDFSVDLINADIVKTQSIEIKDLLRNTIQTQGILVAGQTETPTALEILALELGIEHTEKIVRYYNPAQQNIIDTTITYYQDEGARNQLIDTIIQLAKEDIKNGKNVYVLSDGRRTTQLISEITNNTIVYDRYNRGNPRIQKLMQDGKITDTQLFVSSNAVDVGISLHDPNAVTYVAATENTEIIGSMASTIQKALRNRLPGNTHFHIRLYNNPLPMPFSERKRLALNYETQKQATTQNNELVELKAFQTALNELATNQPNTFIKHHLQYAGRSITSETWQTPETADHIKERRREIIHDENTTVINNTIEQLEGQYVWTAQKIAQEGSNGNLTPVPTTQIAYELAHDLLTLLGWDGQQNEHAEGATRGIFQHEDSRIQQSTWLTALQIIENTQQNDNPRLPDINKIKRLQQGFIGVHYNTITQLEYELEVSNQDIDTTHINDYRNTATLLRILLHSLQSDNTLNEEEIATRIIHTLQYELNGQPIHHAIKQGKLGVPLAKQTRFIDLKTNAKPTKQHIDFINAFIRNNYPAAISSADDGFKLTTQRNFQSIKLATEQYIKNIHPIFDGQAQLTELMPSPENARKTDNDDKVNEAIRQIEQGIDIETITENIGRSKRWINQHTRQMIKDKAIHETTILIGNGVTPQQLEQIINKTRIPKATARALNSNAKKEFRSKQKQTATTMHQQGLTLREIAEQLGISHANVKRLVES